MKPEHIPVEHFAVCEAKEHLRACGKAPSCSSGPALMLLKKKEEFLSATSVSPLF